MSGSGIRLLCCAVLLRPLGPLERGIEAEPFFCHADPPPSPRSFATVASSASHVGSRDALERPWDKEEQFILATLKLGSHMKTLCTQRLSISHTSR